MNLDWFYESQEAEKYLSDTENFKNSFGLLNEEKHSVEYILYHLMRCNYEIEDCIKSETGVILECFFKEHDFSDKWNPDVKLRKAYIFLKCEEPDNTYLIVRERIKAIEHHYGSFCYGEDVEIITEMAEEEFQKLKEKRNVKDEEQQRF